MNTDAKFEALMNEFNEKMTKEKEMIVNNVEAQLKTLIDQVRPAVKLIFIGLSIYMF